MTSKLATIGAVGLLGFALAACEAGGDPGSGSDSEVDETSAAVEETAAGSSPDAPHAAGSTFEIGDWTVTVTDVVLDATEEIMAENTANDEPEEGNQLALVSVEGTYNGDETAYLITDIVIGFYAGDIQYDDCTNVVPDDLFRAPEVENGDIVSGSVCVEFPSAEADSALIFMQDHWSTADVQLVYIEIA